MALPEGESGYLVLKFDVVVAGEEVQAGRGAHRSFVGDEPLFGFGQASRLYDVAVGFYVEDFPKVLTPLVNLFNGMLTRSPAELLLEAV